MRLTNPLLTRSRREAITLAARSQVDLGMARLQRTVYRDHARRLAAAITQVNEAWAEGGSSMDLHRAIMEAVQTARLATEYDALQTTTDPTIQENTPMSVKHAGLSVQFKAEDLPQGRDEAKAYVRDLHQQMEVALRTHIGDVKPRGELIFSLDGPVPDPSVSSIALQGQPEWVYVCTLAVPVETDDLPADCTAYKALRS